MKRVIFILSSCIIILFNSNSYAQSPNNKKLGFGIIIGDPTGLTLIYWNNSVNAWVMDIGASYFGSPRIGLEYLWHFSPFDMHAAAIYAGVGGVVGVGEGHGFWYNNGSGFYARPGSGFGVRGVFGLNYFPKETPLELFAELGVLVGIVPNFGSGIDAAVGIRFYP